MTNAGGHTYLRTHTLQAEHLQLDLEQAVHDLVGMLGDQDRRAVTLVRESGLSVVLVHLRAGAGLDEHATAGAATVQVLAGRVRVAVGNEELDVGDQQLVAFDARVPHRVAALEDATLLLTISAALPSPLEEIASDEPRPGH